MVANAQTEKPEMVNYFSIDGEYIYDFNGSQLNGKTIVKYKVDTVPTFNQDKVMIVHRIETSDYKAPDSPTAKVFVEPGGGMPLIIVDGVESPALPTPTDIKAIEIFKPDSPEAAKYGERGKNGITIITTKSGKPTVNTIYIIDGKKSTEADMKALGQDKIKSVEMLKGKAAKDYTDDPNVGVVIVKTKK